MDEWIPKDRRQAATLDRLSLVGGAAVSFYRDACRIMEGDVRLEATTEVVAHLVRELLGSLLGVLEPMADGVPPRGSENRQTLRVRAIADALGIPGEDPIREDLVEVAGTPHKLAHRSSVARSKPADAPEFQAFWDRGQAVISELARRLEESYGNALAEIDALAAGEPDVKSLGQSVPHSTVAMHRFFSRADLSWFEPLKEAGYFADPPEPEVVDDSVAYQRWPAAIFLVRAASGHPQEVLALAKGLETANPEAHESFVEAALAIDATAAATIVEDVARWLSARFTWGLPFKVRDLVVHLAEGGEVEAATRLMDALLRSARAEDGYLVGELSQELQPALFPASGLRGLEVLAQRLDELVRDDLPGTGDGRHDHSRIWRPDIANDRRRDPRDQLVDAVRGAARILVEDDPNQLEPALALLEARQLSIFRRLALDLLAANPDPDLAEARLGDEELFDDYNVAPEYEALAQACFGSISEETQEKILSWIEAGDGDFDDEERRRQWQMFKLAQLGELSEAVRDRFADLLATGDPEPEEGPPILREGWVGPNSPRSVEDLKAMTPDHLLDWLGTWEPEPQFGGPSPEGLARNLRTVVQADPERYALLAPRFIDVDPTYARAFVGGLFETLKEGRTFAWQPVVDFAVAALKQPRAIEGRDPNDWDRDAGWLGTWRELLRLITGGLDKDQLEADQEAGVWEVISRLCRDPDPGPDDGEFRDSPLTASLNATRPIALRALIGLALWRKRAQEAENLAAETAAVLDQHLDWGQDSSPAVRSIYGQLFPALVFLDPDWAASKVEAIFGDADAGSRDPLGEVAWTSFLHNNYPGATSYGLLRGHYVAHVERLEGRAEESKTNGSDSFLGDVDEALVHHLMGLFMGGSIGFPTEGEFEDSMLATFYERAPLRLRSEAFTSLGMALADEKAGALADDLQASYSDLVGRRIEAVRSSGELSELEGFAWWFRSPALDREWQKATLGTLLEVGVPIQPDHMVAERLADLSDEHPADSARLLKTQLQAGVRNWFVAGARDSIRKILVTALAAGGDAEAQARETVHVLLSRGHSDYEDLLGD